MEKGYYWEKIEDTEVLAQVAIHNKNGKGLLLLKQWLRLLQQKKSQSTIKMEKGYYIP